MSFNTFLPRCVLFIALLRVGANAVPMKSGNQTTPTTILSHTIIHTSNSTASASISSTATTSRGTISASSKSSTIPSSSISYVSPSPSLRACSVKRGITKRECQIETRVAWQLAWISTEDVNRNPWKSTTPQKLSGWNFQWSLDSSWGEDTTIFVIDSGVNKDHDSFEDLQVVPGAHVTRLNNHPEAAASVDLLGHGTAVASLIAGRHVGIARAATIYPIKISTSTERPTPADMVDAINIAVRVWRKIRRRTPQINRKAIINISITVYHSDATLAAVQLAITEGMHVVMAGGNTATNACFEGNQAAPEDTFLKKVGQTVVSGTQIQNIHGQVSDRYSSAMGYGSCIDILAPGHGVITASRDTHRFGPLSGSSYAAAMVSGAMAAFLSSDDRVRQLSPAQFIAVCKNVGAGADFEPQSCECKKMVPPFPVSRELHIVEL